MLSNQKKVHLKLQFLSCQIDLDASSYHISPNSWTNRNRDKLSPVFENTWLASLGFTQTYNYDILHYQLAAYVTNGLMPSSFSIPRI